MQRADGTSTTRPNVEQGHQQLLRYRRRVSSNQGWRSGPAVLMFFVVLFGTVM